MALALADWIDPFRSTPDSEALHKCGWAIFIGFPVIGNYNYDYRLCERQRGPGENAIYIFWPEAVCVCGKNRPSGWLSSEYVSLGCRQLTHCCFFRLRHGS